MPTDKDGDEALDAEVVEGGPRTAAPAPEARKTFFHPYSGLVILCVDWLAFGADFFSGFLALAVVAVAAFIATFWAVSAIQRRLHGDTPGMANLKALLGAAAAGVPFPVTGTIVGTAILALSGLPLPGRPRIPGRNDRGNPVG